MSNTKRICPICRKPVWPTIRANIYGHTDTAGNTCPASGEPYRISIHDKPEIRPKEIPA